MTRSELEALLGAARAAAHDDFVVLGSHALLGEFPELAPRLADSTSVTLLALRHPRRTQKIEETVGEGSPFHAQSGYYAHAVDLVTAAMPGGWRKRLVPVADETTRAVLGFCLEVHDLAFSKYVAGGDHDLRFTAELVRRELIYRDTLLERLRDSRLSRELHKLVRGRIERDFF